VSFYSNGRAVDNDISLGEQRGNAPHDLLDGVLAGLREGR